MQNEHNIQIFKKIIYAELRCVNSALFKLFLNTRIKKIFFKYENHSVTTPPLAPQKTTTTQLQAFLQDLI
jgi:hypothetical protein